MKTWPYLFRFCERHSDCGEDPLLGSSANVAKTKLASNNMSSILNAIGLQRQSQSEHHTHFLMDIGKILESSGVKSSKKVEVLFVFSQVNTVLRTERALRNKSSDPVS